MSETYNSLNSQDIRRAAILPLKIHQENMELRKELLELYEREKRLLKLIDKRDKQLRGATPLAVESSTQISPNNRTDSLFPDAMIEEMNQNFEKLEKERNLLKSRYEALSRSRLGRIQRWYWKQRAGK